MGRAIATAFVQAGDDVVLYDAAAAARAVAADHVPQARITETLDDALDAPIVLETIVEKVNAKKRLYHQIADSPRTTPETILLTNTSTIRISTLSEHVAYPQQFCGLHFFHPVAERPLVEVIPHSGSNDQRGTSPTTLATAIDLARRVGKEPLVVGDSPGFLVNRLLHPYLAEGLALAEAGEDFDAIDDAAVRWGMAKGPFTLMDEIGLDVVWHGGFVMAKAFAKAFPDRVRFSPLLEERLRDERLGVKTGAGFYNYPRATRAQEMSIPHAADTDLDRRVERLLREMYAEAIRCRDDGVITDLAMADTASVKGLGFPIARVGVATWGTCVLGKEA